MQHDRHHHLPLSSYRLQFGRHMTFDQARQIVPYLAALGITDCYASPLLASSSGSEHGYDISNHQALNSALGTDEAFDAFAAELGAHGLGLILDFVPNHMGLDVNTNRWWRDVLEHGQSSEYADYFDIDWDPLTPELKGRVLLPILDDGYGDVLSRGELHLGLTAGAFHVEYRGQILPLDARSSARILRAAFDHTDRQPDAADGDWAEYLSLIETLAHLPSASLPNQPGERRRQSADAKNRLASLLERSLSIRAAVVRAIAVFNGVAGDARSFDALDRLLDEQAYRLAHWKTAFDEINYRRFFDINNLGAIRMEDPRVFTAAHVLVLRLIRERKVTGLRLDHPDGLFDPASYFTNLQEAIAEILPASGNDDAHRLLRGPVYLIAEKVLMPGESLPRDWPIDGTTGYGFLNAVNGLFVSAQNERRVRNAYAQISRRRQPFAEVAYDGKRLIMTSSMASELAVLAHELKRIAGRDRMTRDFTMNGLARAITEVIACFPVYRTYVSSTGPSAADREAIDSAMDRARRRNPVMAPQIFLFLRSVLLTDPSNATDGATGRANARDRLAFAMKFQQFSGPVQAKGVEDTSYFRYNALVSLNEVGGDPRRFGTTVDDFHEGNRVRLDQWPLEMIATATHDTKWGEDARARVNVLSEIPDLWSRTVSRFRRLNATRRTAVDREWAPDANDEYLFYQALVASWPASADLLGNPREAPREYVERLRGFMQKAIKEAKLHTSWVSEQTGYDDAVSRFVETTLGGHGARTFLGLFVPFVRNVARLGMLNSLAQLTLKMASPGVPDFYQGTEWWQLSLTDPDNRQPVDFASRTRALDDLMPLILDTEGDVRRHVETLLTGWTDARIKMFVMARGLRLRRCESHLFRRGTYEPLTTDVDGRHVVAFARRFEGRVLLVVAPRLTSQRPVDGRGFPVGDAAWRDVRLYLPPECAVERFRHIFTGASVTPFVDAGQAYVKVSDIFSDVPFAWLLG